MHSVTQSLNNTKASTHDKPRHPPSIALKPHKHHDPNHEPVLLNQVQALIQAATVIQAQQFASNCILAMKSQPQTQRPTMQEKYNPLIKGL